MIQKNKSVVPFGAFTLILFAAAMVMQLWPVSACTQLEEKLEQGFFMRWMPPQLLLVTSDKKSTVVEGKDKESACEILLQKI